MSQLVFDEDAAKRIDALYKIGDAARRRTLVRAALAAQPGERILDVGCGPGYYCAELLEEVGPEGSVVGIDGSPPMLELAATRCSAHENVELREGEVLSLPVEDGDFDAAICVQVLEYVADATAGLAEIHRTLRPGGRVVVWDIDWATVSMHSQDPERTQRVLRAWDEHLAIPSLPRTLRSRLQEAGFENVGMQAHAFATSEFDAETYAVAVIPFIATFVTGRQGISEDEANAWIAEQTELGERGEFYFACTQVCFTAAKRA